MTHAPPELSEPAITRTRPLAMVAIDRSSFAARNNLFRFVRACVARRIISSLARFIILPQGTIAETSYCHNTFIDRNPTMSNH